MYFIHVMVKLNFQCHTSLQKSFTDIVLKKHILCYHYHNCRYFSGSGDIFIYDFFMHSSKELCLFEMIFSHYKCLYCDIWSTECILASNKSMNCLILLTTKLWMVEYITKVWYWQCKDFIPLRVEGLVYGMGLQPVVSHFQDTKWVTLS